MLHLVLLAVLAAEPALPDPPVGAVPAVVALELGDEVFRKGLVFHEVKTPSLVVTEPRFRLYLDQQLRAERAEAAKLIIGEDLRQCLIRCEGCKAPSPTASSFHSTSFWVGFTIGAVVAVAVTGAAAYGAYTLAQDLSQPK